ncbi:MAG: nucleotidyl transferase AbiEii/AbiGii toxin family protein [Elusimicrobiota bacterium]
MIFLANHPDFLTFVGNTAAEIKLPEELVIKDYWVTAVLRVLATSDELTGKIIFKGGTSLSKGWHLIDRFSEDIDILTTGPDFGAPYEKRSQREKLLKKVRDLILQQTPLQIPDLHDPDYYLMDGHRYYAKIHFAWPQGDKDTVFLEMGFRGGPNPHSKVAINSFIGDHILKLDKSVQDALGKWAEDFTPFTMDLLEPSQTFVEKLLYLHTAVPKKVEDVRTRHLYDIVSIFESHSNIPDLLQSGGYKEQLRNAVEISNRWYGTTLDADAIDFKSSPILNLTEGQADVLASSYKREGLLYFRGQKPFSELLKGLEKIKRKLKV